MHTAVNPVLTKYGLRDRGAKRKLCGIKRNRNGCNLTETAFIDTAFDANLLKIHNLLKI